MSIETIPTPVLTDTPPLRLGEMIQVLGVLDQGPAGEKYRRSVELPEPA